VTAVRTRREGFQNSLMHEDGIRDSAGEGVEWADDKVEILQPDKTPVPRAKARGAGGHGEPLQRWPRGFRIRPSPDAGA
jgi:hypothetical protein